MSDRNVQPGELYVNVVAYLNKVITAAPENPGEDTLKVLDLATKLLKEMKVEFPSRVPDELMDRSVQRMAKDAAKIREMVEGD